MSSIADSSASLAAWRRSVAELYARVRNAEPGARAYACTAFRAERDRLFAVHPSSPLTESQRTCFEGLDYYAYDPGSRVPGRLEPEPQGEPVELEIGEGVLRFTRVARVRFERDGAGHSLDVYWIGGYGGGIFLPFADRCSGNGTYAGGRYLYDTIKCADLGIDAGTMVLDFNYAYNPSCAYSDLWTCPLAPPENRLGFAVRAGERVFRV